MLFGCMTGSSNKDQSDCETAPACDIHEYCTTLSRPGTDGERYGSVPPNTWSKKNCGRIMSVQESLKMLKRWKYVIQAPKTPGVYDTACFKKLKCLQTCNECFLQTKQQKLLILSRAQRRADLSSMLESRGHFDFDGHHVCNPFVMKAFQFSNGIQRSVRSCLKTFLERLQIWNQLPWNRTLFQQIRPPLYLPEQQSSRLMNEMRKHVAMECRIGNNGMFYDSKASFFRERCKCLQPSTSWGSSKWVLIHLHMAQLLQWRKSKKVPSICPLCRLWRVW